MKEGVQKAVCCKEKTACFLALKGASIFGNSPSKTLEWKTPPKGIGNKHTCLKIWKSKKWVMSQAK